MSDRQMAAFLGRRWPQKPIHDDDLDGAPIYFDPPMPYPYDDRDEHDPTL